MNRKLVILTEIIAPYRIPVFNALAMLNGIDLHVIFLAKTDSSMRQWRVYEDEIRFSYEVLPYWRRRIGKYNLLLNHGVGAALRDAAPDVIVCGGYNYLASWQARVWANRNRVPFLLWSESTGQDRRSEYFVVELLKKKFVRSCGGFIVPGQSAMRYLEELGVSRARIFIAHNAVDISLFGKHATAARERSARLRKELMLPERYFLFVGRLVQSKGVMDLLEAYRSIPGHLRSEVGLMFVGDGPMRAELETRAKEIDPGTVRLTGFVHRENLAPYYSMAECLVLPTLTDTWGLVVNEAMACGLPIICTKVAGCAPDLVQASGIVVRPGDRHQLAEAMRKMITDKSMRDSMARESETIIRSYSPEICAAEIAEASRAMEAYA